MATARDFSDVSAVVFDIGGTLLDSTGSTSTEFQRILFGNVDSDTIDQITVRVSSGVSQRMERISHGEEPFALETDIRRALLPEVLAEHGAQVNEEQFEQLVNVGERFNVFADVPGQLDELSRHATVIGLTNSALDQVTKASARTGLRWHSLLGAQFARTYKPAAKVYKLVPDLVGVDPAHALFIAAHPWDLRAATGAGFRTVYLPRPHTDDPDSHDVFDLTVTSLDEITQLLAT